MSADIIFDRGVVWSARAPAFEELMRRASGHCTNAVAIDVLRLAGTVQFLVMPRVEDVSLRRDLCSAVVAAARDLLAELSPLEPFAAQEAEEIQRLIGLAGKCAADISTN
jgi:hypothetical protein